MLRGGHSYVFALMLWHLPTTPPRAPGKATLVCKRAFLHLALSLRVCLSVSFSFSLSLSLSLSRYFFSLPLSLSLSRSLTTPPLAPNNPNP